VRSDSHLQTPRDGLKRALKAALYPHALRIFDAALHVGVKSREYFIHYGYPAERLFFTPHCIDNDWFAERATPGAAADLRAASGVAADATVLLFAGKLLALKRPLDFVEAARQVAVQIPKLTIMIAGDGPLANAVTEAARAARLPLVQLGFCNQSRMPAVYAAADVLVLPSSSETWGLVANEALACGTPIVVSDSCGCAPDLAADGSVGRVAPTGDASALAGAVLDLLAERPSTDAIGKMTTRFSIARAAQGVRDALNFACAPT
jgi:glycosyltransferase involved in cell wall biosynthesis